MSAKLRCAAAIAVAGLTGCDSASATHGDSSLAGAWICATKNEDFSYVETLTLLSTGRYMARHVTMKADGDFTQTKETFGSWEKSGSGISFTIEGGSGVTAGATVTHDPYMPGGPLFAEAVQPDPDTLKLSGLWMCDLKRQGKPAASAGAARSAK